MENQKHCLGDTISFVGDYYLCNRDNLHLDSKSSQVASSTFHINQWHSCPEYIGQANRLLTGCSGRFSMGERSMGSIDKDLETLDVFPCNGVRYNGMDENNNSRLVYGI